MDRAALLATLETANRHIAEGERHIEQQREIVARLEQRGRGASHTATIARQLLLSMERVQRAHRSHRDQVKAGLARLDDFERSPLLSSINASTGAERGSDAYTEVQERS
jgi:hypothetical protein